MSHTKRTFGLLNSLETVNGQLAAARDQALEASRSKSQFLANMSHEIRTPMNGVLATTELVLDTGLTPEQRELISACHVSGQQLLAILNDILDLSRCESGKLTLEQVPFDLRSEVTGVMKLYNVIAQQKGVALSLRWRNRRAAMGARRSDTAAAGSYQSHEQRAQVHGCRLREPDRLERRSSDGPARVGSSSKTQASEYLPGLSPILFSPFVQGDGSTTRRYGGTGLGLAICKQLVALMGGSIDVHSVLGKGSRFVVQVDFEPADAPKPSRSPRRSELRFPRRLHVLVAEDNPVNQLVAQRLLERHGCSVDVVTTGTAAVHRHQTEKYDLILMDCQMPELDGYEAARRIRTANHHDRVPIIASTAQAFPGDRERCMAAGMDDYVSKPINAAQFIATVRRWIPCDVESWCLSPAKLLAHHQAAPLFQIQLEDRVSFRLPSYFEHPSSHRGSAADFHHRVFGKRHQHPRLLVIWKRVEPNSYKRSGKPVPLHEREICLYHDVASNSGATQVS